jgi:hypothetical protein
VICDIQDGALRVLAAQVGNRREIYREPAQAGLKRSLPRSSASIPQHDRPENRIHARLAAFAAGLEPVDYVLVQFDGGLFFLGFHTGGAHGGHQESGVCFRDVGEVDRTLRPGKLSGQPRLASRVWR